MIDIWIAILLLLSFIHECDLSAENVNQFGSKFVLAFNKIPLTEPLLFLYTNGKKNAQVNITRGQSKIGTQVVVASGRVQLVRLNQSQIPYPQKDIGPHRCVVLESSTQFGIHVVIYGLDLTIASYLALPRTAWGRRYYLVTLQSKVFVTVLSDTETIVKFRFNSIPPELYNLMYKDIVSTGNNLFIVFLKRLEAFTISMCSLNGIMSNFSLTGSLVESESPIVVITGTCRHVMKLHTCSEIKKKYPDLSIEMMYPQYTFGDQFVVFTLLHRDTQEMMVALASLPNTNVSMHLRQLKDNNFFIKEAGGFIYLGTVSDTNLFVKSSKPIMLSLIITSSCSRALEPGGPSISTVLPISLMSTVFIWRTPPLHNVTHYMVLIYLHSNAKDVRINIKPFSNKMCQESPRKEGEVYSIQTCILGKDNYVKVESVSELACYFYGIGLGAYFSSGGFQIKGHPTLECIYSYPTAGDTIDNDCDGVADEEVIDLRDNDDDGLCDEDFQATDEPRALTWGPNCSTSCALCQHSCSPIDGSCDTCRPGYKGHLSGCQFQCEENEYGANCSGDCYEKCGTDCLDRETGQCLDTNIIYVIVHYGYPFFLLLASFGLIYFFLCRRRKGTYQSPETENRLAKKKQFS